MNSDQFFFAIFGLDSVSLRVKNKDFIQCEFLAVLRATEKVFAKSGLLCRQFQKKTALSKMLFQISKLVKKEM